MNPRNSRHGAVAPAPQPSWCHFMAPRRFGWVLNVYGQRSECLCDVGCKTGYARTHERGRILFAPTCSEAALSGTLAVPAAKHSRRGGRKLRMKNYELRIAHDDRSLVRCHWHPDDLFRCLVCMVNGRNICPHRCGYRRIARNP